MVYKQQREETISLFVVIQGSKGSVRGDLWVSSSTSGNLINSKIVILLFSKL